MQFKSDYRAYKKISSVVIQDKKKIRVSVIPELIFYFQLKKNTV